MFLKKHWRILTIGDGDLSFSYSLKKHHAIQSLSASVLDAKHTLESKYTHNGVKALLASDTPVQFELDITDQASWPTSFAHQFDCVIFQFPLVPAVKDLTAYQQQLNQNLVNRALLYDYLQACFSFFLDPNGQRLSYISSKEVKPYSHWQIETDLTVNTSIRYIGKQVFDYALFPDYQIRNVDRDKQVKDTKGFIYAYSDIKQSDEVTSQFEPFLYTQENYCPLCRVGPFTSEEDKRTHSQSKKHQKLALYQADWLAYLAAKQRNKP